MGSEVTQQETGDQKPRARDHMVAIATVTPSLRERVIRRSREGGFHTMADGVRTLLRDFVDRKIEYKDGILDRQE
jgi:hypothetical protein